MEHLVKDGVDAKRLRAAGFGSYCALDPAHSEAAYAKNRRVEFRILRRNGKDLDTKWGGCDKALAKGQKPEPIPGTAPSGTLDEKPAVAARPREVELPPAFVGDLEIKRQDACKKGKLDACNALGLQYESGNGAIRDVGKAFAAYKTACDGGNLDGCANVGGVYEDGRGVPGDFAAAQLAYTIACAKGEMEGCDGLGSIFENGHGPVRRGR